MKSVLSCVLSALLLSACGGLGESDTRTHDKAESDDTGDQVALSATTALSNGVAVTSLAGARRSQTAFSFQVPAGASHLQFAMSGGAGDADLYVRYGALPTPSTYDYRPYLDGNNESVAPAVSTEGTWYLMLRGYASYSGVTLVASYLASVGPADAGTSDGGPISDAEGTDGAISDAGSADGSANPDAGTSDGGPISDAGSTDGAISDAGSADGSANPDAGTSDGGAISDAGSGGGIDCTGAASWPTDWAAFEDQVLALVNEHRASGASCGSVAMPAVPPLVVDAALRRAARCHCLDMATHNYFDHTSKDGRSPWDRITAAGYTGFGNAENIAAGQSTPASVVGSWMSSTGHCDNVMSAGSNEIGVGYAFAASASYGHYWTQDFGKR
jgi:uncharacterized protein YkwD